MNTEQMIAEFLAKGGKVTECPEGATAAQDNDGYGPEFICRCGCGGDYTEHRMREAERGQRNGGF